MNPPDEITRREILERLGVNLRRFRRTTIYAMLRIDEIVLTRRDVRYPRAKVQSAFRARGMKF